MLIASEYKQVTSTTVLESTGNVIAVCIVSIQSGFSPLHISGRTESSVFKSEVNYTKELLHLSILLKYIIVLAYLKLTLIVLWLYWFKLESL